MEVDHLPDIQPPIRLRARKLLAERFPYISDFDAFVLDFFPRVYRQFSGGQDRTSKENLFLVSVDPEEILKAIGVFENFLNGSNPRPIRGYQQIIISITADIDQLKRDEKRIKRIFQKKLRKITNEKSLTVEEIRIGSVLIVVHCSWQGAQKLLEHDLEKLSTSLEYLTLSITWDPLWTPRLLMPSWLAIAPWIVAGALPILSILATCVYVCPRWNLSTRCPPNPITKPDMIASPMPQPPSFQQDHLTWSEVPLDMASDFVTSRRILAARNLAPSPVPYLASSRDLAPMHDLARPEIPDLASPRDLVPVDNLVKPQIPDLARPSELAPMHDLAKPEIPDLASPRDLAPVRDLAKPEIPDLASPRDLAPVRDLAKPQILDLASLPTPNIASEHKDPPKAHHLDIEIEEAKQRNEQIDPSLLIVPSGWEQLNDRKYTGKCFIVGHGYVDSWPVAANCFNEIMEHKSENRKCTLFYHGKPVRITENVRPLVSRSNLSRTDLGLANDFCKKRKRTYIHVSEEMLMKSEAAHTREMTKPNGDQIGYCVSSKRGGDYYEQPGYNTIIVQDVYNKDSSLAQPRLRCSRNGKLD